MQTLTIYRGQAIAIYGTPAFALNGVDPSGYGMAFTLRKLTWLADGTVSPVLQLTTTAGISVSTAGVVYIPLSSAQTNLVPGTYAWDLERTDTGQEDILATGKLVVLQSERLDLAGFQSPPVQNPSFAYILASAISARNSDFQPLGIGALAGASGRVADAQHVHPFGPLYDKGGAVYNVLAYGADPTGINDSAPAFTLAYAALKAAGARRLYAPYGRYLLNSSIIIDANDVIIYGDGWYTQVSAPYANTQWTTQPFTGTVLMPAAGVDGIRLTAAAKQVQIRDLAILGPGTGSGTGLNFVGSSVTFCVVDNLFIANFNLGWYNNVAISCYWGPVHVYGCNTGIRLDNSNTDQHFTYLDVQNCTTGLSHTGGAHIHLLGGAFQANGTAISLNPQYAPMVGVTVQNTWFEANTVARVAFNTTSFGVQHVTLRKNRMAGGATDGGITFTGSNSITQLVLDNNYAPSVSLVVPSTVSSLEIRGNNTWSSLNFSAVTGFVWVFDSQAVGTHAGVVLGNVTIDYQSNTCTFASPMTATFGAAATFNGSATFNGAVTFTTGIGFSAGNGVTWSNNTPAQAFLGYVPTTNWVLRDIVNSRNLLTQFPGSAGNASFKVQDQLQLAAASGQGADILPVTGQGGVTNFRLNKNGVAFFAGGTATPSNTPGTGAGTGPTVTISGSDQAGLITITTGSSPAANATLVTVTFSATYGAAPRAISLDPANANAAGANVWVDSASAAAGTFTLKVGTALAASTTYTWYFFVAG